MSAPPLNQDSNFAADAVGNYVILGACNPTLASRALAAEPEPGALLPCNDVVRRGKDGHVTTGEAIDPQTMVELSGSPVIREVGDDANADSAKPSLGSAPQTHLSAPSRALIPGRVRSRVGTVTKARDDAGRQASVLRSGKGC